MNCKVALEMLAQQPKTYTDEMVKHIEDCSACWSRFERFVQDIHIEAEEEISCEECSSQLLIYYEVEKLNQELSSELTSVANHLQNCPYCAEEYAALRDTLPKVINDTLPELTSIPKPDLSFLPAPPILWFSSATEHVKEFFREIIIKLDDTKASFATFPSHTLQLDLPTVRRSGKEEIDILELPDPDAGLEIQLSALPVKSDKVAITVKLLEFETKKPLPGAQVILYNSDHHMLAGSATKEEGRIKFTNLQMQGYFIQVRRSDKRWEMPLKIVNVKERGIRLPKISSLGTGHTLRYAEDRRQTGFRAVFPNTTVDIIRNKVFSLSAKLDSL